MARQYLGCSRVRERSRSRHIKVEHVSLLPTVSINSTPPPPRQRKDQIESKAKELSDLQAALDIDAQQLDLLKVAQGGVGRFHQIIGEAQRLELVSECATVEGRGRARPNMEKRSKQGIHSAIGFMWS